MSASGASCRNRVVCASTIAARRAGSVPSFGGQPVKAKIGSGARQSVDQALHATSLARRRARSPSFARELRALWLRDAQRLADHAAAVEDVEQAPGVEAKRAERKRAEREALLPAARGG